MPPNRSQTFAIVPAAGASRRMGTHKLLLPIGGGGDTVIERVLSAWLASRVDHVVLVTRPDDREVRDIGERLGAEVVVPETAPAEMKDSVALAIWHIEKKYQPTDSDAWLLAPADMPRLDPGVIDQLLAAYRRDDPAPAINLRSVPAATLVPVSGGRRGHPILFPWSRSREVSALPAGRGVNFLVQTGQIVELPVDDAGILEDLDTPDDYKQLG